MSATDTYHHGDLRRALLDAALVLIGKKGVAGLSLREVAAGVGVSHAAPYHHFADKTALIHALGNEGMELLDAHMASAEKAAGDDPRARLLGIGMAYVTFAVQHPEYYATFSSPEMQTPPSAKEAAASDRTPGGTWVRLFNAVLACQASGDLPAGDPMVLAVYLWSLVHGLAELWRT
ncbi:MAG: TetR/AcrR family transcriptional regulator, partial [Coriobacteriia bacterium]|nr:TetR/AcrR family transcriptional regulator [Coriobacteriia bacterium]